MGIEVFDKERAKELFLSQFSDSELLELRGFLTQPALKNYLNKSLWGIDLEKASAETIRTAFPLNPIFKMLNRLLYKGKLPLVWFNGEAIPDYRIIIREIPKIKQLIEDYEKQWLEQLYQAWIAENDRLGQVRITIHALERFRERFIEQSSYNKEISDYECLMLIKRFFKKSHKIDIDSKSGFFRLVNNCGRPAEYWYNSGANLRFVISCDTPRTILTVEAPRKHQKRCQLPDWYQRYLKNQKS